ncbi:MAG: hypothetical protein HW403_1209, partial [Dehalococcoidia bacterium]|nr:hypothetical protein [Dehalococcoidia bacterium]
MRKDDTSSKVYLGVADRQIEQIVSQADFERNLMVNLLFQKEIIVPDIFWFISRRIQSHVNRRVSPSLLEEALAQGVVLPYFRQTSCSSFVDAYREIKREGILGVLPTAGQLAERLEKTIENNSKYRFGDWGGQNMAINYEKTVKEYLQRAEPANLNYLEDRKRRELLQLWNRTKEWRYELIEEAINRTEGGGLRRGEIMSALGRRVKYPYEQVHDVRYLYGLL